MTPQNAKSEARVGRTGERGALAPEDAPVYRLAVGGGELRTVDQAEGKVHVEFEREGKVLLSWTAPAVEPPKPADPPVPPPAPVQPIPLPVPPRSAPDTSDDEHLLRVEEVAAKLRLSRTTVYRMAAEGKLPSIRIAFSRRFSAAAIEAWLTEHRGEMAEVGGD